MKKIFFTTLFSLVSASLIVQAKNNVSLIKSTHIKSNEIQLGEISYGGSGCPAGTLFMDLNSDLNVISFIADDYQVSNENKLVDRKSCSLSLPINVPKGYRLVLPGFNMTGFSFLEDHAEARLDAEVFVAGERGPTSSMTLRSGSTEEVFPFLFLINQGAGTPFGCGSDVNLRLNSSILLRSTELGKSRVGVDQIKMKIPLILQKCL